MALLYRRSAGLCLPMLAVLMLGVASVASAADPEATAAARPLPAGPSGDDSASRLRTADFAIPALDIEELASANGQAGPAAQRSSSRPADARRGLTGHFPAVVGGLLVVALVIVGIAVTVVGLRDDLRKRRRGYRRRSRRIRTPIQPEEKRASST